MKLRIQLTDLLGVINQLGRNLQKLVKLVLPITYITHKLLILKELNDLLKCSDYLAILDPIIHGLSLLRSPLQVPLHLNIALLLHFIEQLVHLLNQLIGHRHRNVLPRKTLHLVNDFQQLLTLGVDSILSVEILIIEEVPIKWIKNQALLAEFCEKFIELLDVV